MEKQALLAWHKNNTQFIEQQLKAGVEFVGSRFIHRLITTVRDERLEFVKLLVEHNALDVWTMNRLVLASYDHASPAVLSYLIRKTEPGFYSNVLARKVIDNSDVIEFEMLLFADGIFVRLDHKLLIQKLFESKNVDMFKLFIKIIDFGGWKVLSYATRNEQCIPFVLKELVVILGIESCITSDMIKKERMIYKMNQFACDPKTYVHYQPKQVQSTKTTKSVAHTYRTTDKMKLWTTHYSDEGPMYMRTGDYIYRDPRYINEIPVAMSKAEREERRYFRNIYF